jgi:hypothetical protein
VAALTPVDAALSVGQRIGRYFTLVSMIPSLFLVLWIYILIASGSLSKGPELDNVGAALSHWSLGKVAGVVLVTLAVAVVLHPLQFATTQLLEGYWGTTSLAIAAMKIRIVHHRKRQRHLMKQERDNRRAVWEEILGAVPEKLDPGQAKQISRYMRSKLGDKLMLHIIAEREARDQREMNYPDDPRRVLPTQLGNALRRFEDAAGGQYGLSALAIAPHLHLVAPPRHLEYLVDARQDMDSAIRICTVGLVAAVVTVGALLTNGLWMLWALLPYAISYLAYKGAVSAAQSYGSVIGSVIDLDRFLLYDELGLYPPRDTTEERKNNAKLMRLLTGGDATVHYRR